MLVSSLCHHYEQLRINNEKEFYIKAKKIHNDIYNYELVEYINTNVKIRIICKKCKKIFEQTPNKHKHLQGKGCSYCNFSKGELKCEEILENIEYVKEVMLFLNLDMMIVYILCLLILKLKKQLINIF